MQEQDPGSTSTDMTLQLGHIRASSSKSLSESSVSQSADAQEYMFPSCVSGSCQCALQHTTRANMAGYELSKGQTMHNLSNRGGEKTGGKK